MSWKDTRFENKISNEVSSGDLNLRFNPGFIVRIWVRLFQNKHIIRLNKTNLLERKKKHRCCLWGQYGSVNYFTSSVAFFLLLIPVTSCCFFSFSYHFNFSDLFWWNNKYTRGIIIPRVCSLMLTSFFPLYCCHYNSIFFRPVWFKFSYLFSFSLDILWYEFYYLSYIIYCFQLIFLVHILFPYYFLYSYLQFYCL